MAPDRSLARSTSQVTAASNNIKRSASQSPPRPLTTSTTDHPFKTQSYHPNMVELYRESMHSMRPSIHYRDSTPTPSSRLPDPSNRTPLVTTTAAATTALLTTGSRSMMENSSSHNNSTSGIMTTIDRSNWNRSTASRSRGRRKSPIARIDKKSTVTPSSTTLPPAITAPTMTSTATPSPPPSTGLAMRPLHRVPSAPYLFQHPDNIHHKIDEQGLNLSSQHQVFDSQLPQQHQYKIDPSLAPLPSSSLHSNVSNERHSMRRYSLNRSHSTSKLMTNQMLQRATTVSPYKEEATRQTLHGMRRTQPSPYYPSVETSVYPQRNQSPQVAMGQPLNSGTCPCCLRPFPDGNYTALSSQQLQILLTQQLELENRNARKMIESKSISIDQSNHSVDRNLLEYQRTVAVFPQDEYISDLSEGTADPNDSHKIMGMTTARRLSTGPPTCNNGELGMICPNHSLQHRSHLSNISNSNVPIGRAVAETGRARRRGSGSVISFCTDMALRSSHHQQQRRQSVGAVSTSTKQHNEPASSTTRQQSRRGSIGSVASFCTDWAFGSSHPFPRLSGSTRQQKQQQLYNETHHRPNSLHTPRQQSLRPPPVITVGPDMKPFHEDQKHALVRRPMHA